MDIVILQNIWFCLLPLLLGMFIMLGGFDFGACIIGVKSKIAADFAIGSIAPFWDANQVWLITAGGALFAAFPAAYSGALSNLYIPVMLFLAAIISRVAAIEFYFVKESDRWRGFWRYAASVSSAAAILLLGVALSVIFSGKVYGRSGGFSEKFLSLFSVSSVFCGIALLAFACAHGALFLCAKGKDGQRLFSRECKISFYVLFASYTLYALSLSLSFGEIFLFSFSIALIICSHFLFAQKRFGAALITNGIFALSAVAAHAFSAYPFIVPPEVAVSNSSSAKTLSIMLVVAGVGVPTILAYTAYTYRVFLKKNGNQS